MKKWIIALSLIGCSSIHAESTAIVRHIIINGASHSINYELNDPTGTVYRGGLTPGQMKTIYLNDLPEKLFGTYSLSTNECYWNWFSWTCKPNSKLFFVKQNEEIFWNHTEKEITISETVL